MKTKEELRKIREELENPIYNGLTQFEIVTRINSKIEVVYGDVDNIDILRELPAFSNPNYNNKATWEVVKLAAAYDGSNPVQLAIKDVADRLIFTFETRLPINMGGASFESLSSAALQTGLFTQEQLLKLKELGKTYKSRAEILGLSYVTVDDVVKARKS